MYPDRPFFHEERTVAKHPELVWSTRDIQGSLPSESGFSIIIWQPSTMYTLGISGKPDETFLSVTFFSDDIHWQQNNGKTRVLRRFLLNGDRVQVGVQYRRGVDGKQSPSKSSTRIIPRVDWLMTQGHSVRGKLLVSNKRSSSSSYTVPTYMYTSTT